MLTRRRTKDKMKKGIRVAQGWDRGQKSTAMGVLMRCKIHKVSDAQWLERFSNKVVLMGSNCTVLGPVRSKQLNRSLPTPSCMTGQPEPTKVLLPLLVPKPTAKSSAGGDPAANRLRMVGLCQSWESEPQKPQNGPSSSPSGLPLKPKKKRAQEGWPSCLQSAMYGLPE